MSIFGVPYSEHSSFRELVAFVMSLNIDRITTTVIIEPDLKKAGKKWITG
ncbi:28181_t:CDS:2 [Gigaspora margarita]|uniref:28181_t:CDS:1 n=1 Tax=Gigaspora margarita TaxID=4874 RepID=A0ABN7W1R1_GIGMA|nr:28181_t:CDS:2 [Gigaspora margarita]